MSGHPAPFFYIEPDGTLAITVEPGQLCVCQECPNLHVRVFTDATPEKLQRLADAFRHLADHLDEVWS